MAESESPEERTAALGPKSVAAGMGALLSVYAVAQRQTGTLRALRVLGQANQRRGFDCPGCAWPDPNSRSVAEFCENGAKAILDEATTRRVEGSFFEKHSLAELKSVSERWLNDQGRLSHPLLKRADSSYFEPISNEEALDFIAEELGKLSEPNRAAFYTSGRTSNEAAFLYQLLARSLGTNNLPDCSNLCHESSGVALKEALGIGKGTVRLEDFALADVILVIGQNPGSNHPRMLTTLAEANARGATIVSINPLVETGFLRFAHPQHPEQIVAGGVPVADRFVRVAIGGDQALFRGLSKRFFELDKGPDSPLNGPFLEGKTEGFDAYRALVEATEWRDIERLSGLSRTEIESLAALCASAKNLICTWAMGLTQHVHAVATIQEIVNFVLLAGHVGRPGAGVCPVRGHSNVQGDRTMGIVTELPSDYARRLEEHFEFQLPQSPGLDSIGTIQALQRGEVTHFMALGGNFLSACPDTAITESALSKAKLTIHVTTKLNRSHLFGETIVLLPCLGRSEVDEGENGPERVSVENSMGIVSASQGNLRGPASVLGEPRIIALLGKKLFAAKKARTNLRWDDYVKTYSEIRRDIEKTISGFEDFEARLGEGIELPNGPRHGQFRGGRGRALFVCHSLQRLEPEEGELILSTVRSHDQFNTTVYSDTDRYRGIVGRRVVLLHPEDLASRGLVSGEKVFIESFHRGSDGSTSTRNVTGFTALAYDTRRGEAIAYFPEANPLFFLDSYAEKSRTPTSKAVRIRVSPTKS